MNATTVPDITYQNGMSTSIGGSADAFGGNVGGEVSLFRSPDTNNIYWGFTGMVGVGAPIPAELHGEVAYSYVNGFNIYDLLEKIYIKIMEW